MLWPTITDPQARYRSRAALRDEERAWIGSRDMDCTPDPKGGTAAMLAPTSAG
ncbi:MULTISPECIES: lysozyme inhibitor LprI family protein [unclassified Pseudomonas]|uniref:lysozyme inhibitor LprI family protein n=1 Tax=unclassified Pseudomonas TaxID=196821 RepID=UPI003FA37EDD